jgi:hypothetical protein
MYRISLMPFAPVVSSTFALTTAFTVTSKSLRSQDEVNTQSAALPDQAVKDGGRFSTERVFIKKLLKFINEENNARQPAWCPGRLRGKNAPALAGHSDLCIPRRIALILKPVPNVSADIGRLIAFW